MARIGSTLRRLRSASVSLGSLFYLHDLIWGTFPRLFPPGWSLEVEVQFYVLAPLLFWLWTRLSRARARATMAATFFAGGVALSILDPKTLGPAHVEFSLLHYFNFFWLGIVLAYFRAPLADWIAPRSAGFATALGWLGPRVVRRAAGARGRAQATERSAAAAGRLSRSRRSLRQHLRAALGLSRLLRIGHGSA